jgi:DNA anti-recombination protein RmuC
MTTDKIENQVLENLQDIRGLVGQIAKDMVDIKCRMSNLEKDINKLSEDVAMIPTQCSSLPPVDLF